MIPGFWVEDVSEWASPWSVSGVTPSPRVTRSPCTPTRVGPSLVSSTLSREKSRGPRLGIGLGHCCVRLLVGLPVPICVDETRYRRGRGGRQTSVRIVWVSRLEPSPAKYECRVFLSASSLYFSPQARVGLYVTWSSGDSR